ncbi:hypothetical protein V7O66_13030 [Methanolobus sp. ZRKC3]|uniref:COG1361 S-layer family protein n=1 Tax=Methanolobus sp. ZRKC3 TaxID=3125786 RepID=UPI0032473B13
MKGKNNQFYKFKNLIICIGLILTLFSSPAASSSAATLKVDVIEYDPYPAEIGEYVDVYVKIENTGHGRADSVSIKLEPEYPFSLDSEKNAVEYIGILSPEDAAVHEYRLFVDRDAKVGTGSIDIFYQADNGDAWFKESFDLRVGSNNFDSKGTVELESFICEPSVFMPGDHGTITFTLSNTATSNYVTVDGKEYDTNARVQSATLKGDGDIEVKNDVYAGSGVIAPGDSVTLSYNVEIPDELKDDTYHLELLTVGNSHVYNSNWRIPVKVDSASVKVIPSNPLSLVNGEGTLEFDVANTHPNELTSIGVTLKSDEVKFSPETYFIGTMDSDELFTIEVHALTESENSTVPVQIEVEYRNGMNEHVIVVADRDVDLLKDEENSSTGALITGFGAVALLSIPAVIMFRRKNR